MANRIILALSLVLIMNGCTPSEEQKEKKIQKDKIVSIFISKYGGEDVFVCENGFLIHRYFSIYENTVFKRARLQKDTNDVPIRCEVDISIEKIGNVNNITNIEG